MRPTLKARPLHTAASQHRVSSGKSGQRSLFSFTHPPHPQGEMTHGTCRSSRGSGMHGAVYFYATAFGLPWLNGLIKNFFNDSASQFASFFTKETDLTKEELEDLKAIIDVELKKK